MICLALFLSSSASSICNRYRHALAADEQELLLEVTRAVTERASEEIGDFNGFFKLVVVVRTYSPLEPQDLYTLSELLQDVPDGLEAAECEPFWWLWAYQAKPEVMPWKQGQVDRQASFSGEEDPAFRYPWQLAGT